MHRERRAGKCASIVCFVWFLITPAAAYAQGATIHTASGASVSRTAQQPSSDEEEFIKPSRPDLADPAEFQTPGVLQVEYGADASFHAEEFSSQQRTPLTLRFAASRRLLLEAEIDLVDAEREEEGGRRETGVGDTRLGFQVLALTDEPGRPALAFAYLVKLPSASETRGLGTGRTDHRIVALLSKKFGEKVDLDFNAAYLNVGREGSERRASGGQAALSMSRQLTDRFGVIGEVSGQSEEDILPPGIYPLGALTFKPSWRVQFDVGVRFGIGAAAPRVGVFGGITVGVANLFRGGR